MIKPALFGLGLEYVCWSAVQRMSLFRGDQGLADGLMLFLVLTAYLFAAGLLLSRWSGRSWQASLSVILLAGLWAWLGLALLAGLALVLVIVALCSLLVVPAWGLGIVWKRSVKL